MITYKTNSTRGFLQRNLAKCPTYVKRLSYTTFVCPILDYACTIWSPYYQTYIHSIEMVQRRAARFVMNKYSNYDSVSQILDTLGPNTLDDRHNKLRAVMVYKIILSIILWTLNLATILLLANSLPGDTITGFSSYQHISTLTSTHSILTQ